MIRIVFLLCVFIITFYGTAYAHIFKGEHINWAQEDIPKIEAYFKKPLDKILLIQIVPTRKAYYDELIRYKIPDAAKLSRTSYAVTSAGNVILINSEELSRKHFAFILAHEMTHQYQIEKYGAAILKKRSWMEKNADYHAKRISGYNKY